MKSKSVKIIITLGMAVAGLASCNKDLNLVPTNDVTASTVYSSSTGYRTALAKVYGSFALTGNTGGVGNPDISTQIISDEGNSDFLRMYFNLQELTTDEAAWTWQNDAGIQGLHEMSWSSINPIIDGLYYRSFFRLPCAMILLGNPRMRV
jgi:starch-binding outer membrane protein, SusD/RagB family